MTLILIISKWIWNRIFTCLDLIVSEVGVIENEASALSWSLYSKVFVSVKIFLKIIVCDEFARILNGPCGFGKM